MAIIAISLVLHSPTTRRHSRLVRRLLPSWTKRPQKAALGQPALPSASRTLTRAVPHEYIVNDFCFQLCSRSSCARVSGGSRLRRQHLPAADVSQTSAHHRLTADHKYSDLHAFKTAWATSFTSSAKGTHAPESDISGAPSITVINLKYAINPRGAAPRRWYGRARAQTDLGTCLFGKR